MNGNEGRELVNNMRERIVENFQVTIARKSHKERKREMGRE